MENRFLFLCACSVLPASLGGSEYDEMLLLELQRLKQLDRTGWTLRGLPVGSESIAAHSYGVACTAMLLAHELQAQGVVIDVGRLLQIALVHDWAEARTGDLPRAAAHYFGADARRRAETAALDDMVSELKEACAGILIELHAEYEARTSLEARLVKAADVIDLLLQALTFERAGARGLDEFWEVANNFNVGLTGKAAEVVQDMVRSVVDERLRSL